MDIGAAHKTARLTVLLSPADKKGIEERARGLDMSVGEYVRRASRSYEPELDHETLQAAVEQWASNMDHMRKTIAETLEHSAKRRAERDAMRKARHGAG